MAGTAEGARKTAQKIKERYGREFYVRLGRKGGAAGGNGRGFACKRTDVNGLTGPERARIAGARGGSVGRRGYKYLYEKFGNRYYENRKTGKIEKVRIKDNRNILECLIAH